MMQVEPLSSIKSDPASAAISVAFNGGNHDSSSLESPVPSPQNLSSILLHRGNGSSKAERISKQAITPINGKANLLKFLNGSKTGVFKTIGDRIVVPMKLSTPSKKIIPASSTASCVSATFRMAVPSTKNLPFHSINNKPTDFGKIIPKETNVSDSENRANVFSTKHIKTECVSETSSENGDLNKFMNSISRSVLYPIKVNDYNNSTVQSGSKNDQTPSSIKPNDLTVEEGDEELTSLSWLSSNNKELLKAIRRCNPDDPGIGLSGDEVDDENTNVKHLIFTASSRINSQNTSSSQGYNDFKYNPLCKPPYSFSCLIFMAIEDSYLKRLPVKEIYSWVCKHFPYFRSAPSGWKNSIRHNLSLNRCFKKAECGKFSAKGSLWCIDPAYRPNLVQALKRSPYYPYLHPTGMGQPLSLNNLANLLPGAYTGRVPSWTPTLPPSTLWADRDMASAALNLMGLRGNDCGTTNNTELISNTLDEIFRDADWLSKDRRRQRCDSTESVGSEELVIKGEAQDHTYSVAPSKKRIKREEKRCKSPQSDKSAPDAAYEFESAELSDDLADESADWIVEDIVIDEQEETEDQSLFDSGFGSMKSFKVGRDAKDPKRKTAKPSKPEKGRTFRIKPLTKVITRYSKAKPVKSARKATNRNTNARSLTVRIKPSPTSIARKASKEKSSDVDSGKDSPKVVRKSRSRSLKQRNLRNTSKSKYHTRSSGHKLLGQADEKRKFTIKKRKRRSSHRMGAAVDDEEEIKLAAGSLMRLAGLLNSPTSPSKRGVK